MDEFVRKAMEILKAAPASTDSDAPIACDRPGVPSFKAGDIVEWLSPTLPKQRAEVLAVYEDGTFEAFHPLSECVCQMLVAWVTRVLNTEDSL